MFVFRSLTQTIYPHIRQVIK